MRLDSQLDVAGSNPVVPAKQQHYNQLFTKTNEDYVAYIVAYFCGIANAIPSSSVPSPALSPPSCNPTAPAHPKCATSHQVDSTRPNRSAICNRPVLMPVQKSTANGVVAAQGLMARNRRINLDRFCNHHMMPVHDQASGAGEPKHTPATSLLHSRWRRRLPRRESSRREGPASPRPR